MKAALFQKRAEHQPIHSNPSLPQVVAENDPALVNTPEHVLGRIKLYTEIVLEKALATDEWTFEPVSPELLDQWLRPTPEWQAEQANYSPATKQRILKALMTELQALQNAATGANRDSSTVEKTAAAVDTPAFKSWFGASKIVDAQGNPLRMYHGAIWNGPQTSGTFYPKTYLTPDPAYASRYARSYGSVYPLYAKCTKPLDLRYLGVDELSGEALREVLTSKGIDPYAVQDHGSAELDPERCRYASYPLWGWFTRTSTLGELIQRAGFDGVWMMEIGDAGGEPVEALIVWSPDQIKSAIGNNGDFDPGNAQITASDRKVKDTLKFQGLDIAVEYPAGATRKGVAPDGTKWERPVTFPYGYIKRTDGADGDSIDCYVGPNEDAPLVYVVNQFQKDGTFDEHKVMLGFDDAQAALKGYLVHMPDDWTQYGPLTSMTLPEFRHWLYGDTSKAASRTAGHYDPSGNKPGSLLSEDPSYKGTRVMLYRAVPAHITSINPKDFVTLKQRFAEEHADTSAVYEEEPFRVLKALVPAEQVACANNPGEYFYVGTAPIEGRAIYEFDPDTARGHRMASLPDQDITGATYYHGTSTLTKASGILRQGIRADKGFKRWGAGLEAMAGRVYMTKDLDEALQYACFDYERTTNGYLFVIPGSLLTDVHPDEDALGKLAVRSWSVFYQNLAHLLDGFETRLVELIQEHQLLRAGETPEFEGTVALGKALIPLLSDDETLQALRRTSSLAHQGTVFPTVCYRIDKDNPPSSMEELEKCPQLPVAKAASEEVGAPRIQEGGGDVRISLGDADVIAHIIPERAQAIVESLFVPLELRGKGIGTILMGTLAAWLKDHGVHYLTGLDVSEHGESSKIRQKIPGETQQFSRAEEGHGEGAFPEAPDALKEVLLDMKPDKDGRFLVTRLAAALGNLSLDNCRITASKDKGIGSGDHAATTDSSGRFWGNAGAGCVFFAQDTGRILLSYRSEFVNEPHTWGVWGGAIDDGENPRNAALREVREETGYDGNVQLRQAYVYTNGDFRYTTFLAVVPKEFVPRLDWETEDFKWCDMDDFPSPIHFGLKAALGPIKSLVKPMLKEKVSGGKFNTDLKDALSQTEHKEAATIENGIYSMPLEEAVDEHEKLVDALQTRDPQALQEEAEEQGGELQEMKAKMAALVAKIAEELPAPVIEDFYQTTSDAMQGGVKTFNAFLAQLQKNLGDKWPGFLHAVGGYTGLRPVWDAVVEQDEDDLKQSLEDLRISPRLPSASPTLRGKPREVPLEDPHGEVKLQPDLNTMLQDPEALKHNVGLMLDYPEFRGIRGGTTQEKAEQIIEHMTDNLVWLYEQWHASHRTRAKSWYVGGNRIAHRWAQRFDCSAQAVAGVMAALSPQQHWFQNVTLAERVLSIVTEHANEPWDAAMTKVLKTRDWGKGKISRSYVEEGEDNEEAEEGEEKKDVPRPTPVSLLPILEGKTLQDLEDGTSSGDYLQALWIRAYDEAHNPNACRIVSPEGEFGDWYRKQDGKPVKNRWASFSALMKAVAIFKDPSTENISNIVGANHKVRSFYNNLIAPMSSGGDVTVDTHAVAAALLRPLAASSIPVSHNFGSGKAAQKAVRARPAYTDAKGKRHKAVEGHPRIPAVPGPASSNVTGVTGLYAFYAEAYRRAAAKVGIMPREMQSITWEAVRGLFKPHQKRKNHMEQADAYWKDYSDGYTDKETTRGKLLDFFGGIEEPAWALPNPRNSQGERHSSYSGQLPRPDGPDGGPGGTTRPRGRAGTPARASVQGVGKAALFQKRASDTSHLSNQVTAGLFQRP